jgi:hypothetical protein
MSAKKMTRSAALKEAGRRWGPRAAVNVYRRPDGTKWLSVGFVFMGMALWVRGAGLSWEAAFEDADSKASKVEGRKS